MSLVGKSPATVRLKPKRAKPFFFRHPWVFSGAVASVEGTPGKGDVVAVTDAQGRFIGRGFYNPDSQILVRLITWDPDVAIDDAFWRVRIEQAVRLRHDVLQLPQRTDACRLVYSESDGVPGLVVDQYSDFLAVQFLTAGVASRRDLFLDLLLEILTPQGIVLKGDEETSNREGIAAERGAVRGQAPVGPVETHSDGMTFLVDIAAGQKTGFFLDQRDNRLAAARVLHGRSVLDAFCYTGGFGMAACRLGGAADVLGLDSSAPAVDLARRNYELNALARAEARVAQVAGEFRALKKTGRTFGAVILDPPKFARSRPGVPRALRAYRDVNLLAMQLLEPGGILVTCSCSSHVREADFIHMLNGVAMEVRRDVQVLERRGQAPDHPAIVSCPETAYLKCLICRV